VDALAVPPTRTAIAVVNAAVTAVMVATVNHAHAAETTRDVPALALAAKTAHVVVQNAAIAVEETANARTVPLARRARLSCASVTARNRSARLLRLWLRNLYKRRRAAAVSRLRRETRRSRLPL